MKYRCWMQDMGKQVGRGGFENGVMLLIEVNLEHLRCFLCRKESIQVRENGVKTAVG